MNTRSFCTVGSVLYVWQHLVHTYHLDKDNDAGIDLTFVWPSSSNRLQLIGLERPIYVEKTRADASSWTASRGRLTNNYIWSLPVSIHGPSSDLNFQQFLANLWPDFWPDLQPIEVLVNVLLIDHQLITVWYGTDLYPTVWMTTKDPHSGCFIKFETNMDS